MAYPSNREATALLARPGGVHHRLTMCHRWSSFLQSLLRETRGADRDVPYLVVVLACSTTRSTPSVRCLLPHVYHGGRPWSGHHHPVVQ